MTYDHVLIPVTMTTWMVCQYDVCMLIGVVLQDQTEYHLVNISIKDNRPLKL